MPREVIRTGYDVISTNDDFRVLSGPQLVADPWVASSLLQKAIRRGEVETAQRAALALHKHRGNGIWRRLMVIAFEDVGIGSIDALITSVVAASDPAWRERTGGDREAIAGIVRLLAESPKDRSSDYLICTAKEHPSLEGVRELVGSSSIDNRLELLDRDMPLTEQAIAAWYCSGIEWGKERRLGRGDLPRLMQSLNHEGTPASLLRATQFAITRTREPITIMVPVLWLALSKDGPSHVSAHPVPDTRVINDIPLYALDKHTSIGKQAIDRFAMENQQVRHTLADHVADNKAQRVAGVAAFYADAAPVSLRLHWTQSATLEALGTEADMYAVGIAADGVQPILDAVSENLDHLNDIRAEMLNRRYT